MRKCYNISMINSYVKTVILAALFVAIGVIASPALAYMDPTEVLSRSRNESELVCNVMYGLGLPCGPTRTTTNTTVVQTNAYSGITTPNSPNSSQVDSTTTSSNYSGWSWFGTSNLSASIYNGNIVKKYTNNQISLVKSPTNPSVFEIIDGKKHMIPNEEIFNDYSFKKEMVRTVSQTELDRYPRARLIQANGDKKIYYLTENGLKRLIPNSKIYESYGNRSQDIVTISKKELNYYPENLYIYRENPLNRDVFMITNGLKQYLTPMAVRHANLKEWQIAPVNQYEFNYYKTGAPIIY